MSHGSVDIDRITRAVDVGGVEWVPAREYDREEAKWETLRCMVVNPHRNARRALDALTRGDLDKAKYFLATCEEQLGAAYDEAFPR